MSDKELKVIEIEQNINENLIEYLENLLEYAKKGQLQTFSGVGVFRDGSIITVKSLGDFVDLFKLLGAITNLQLVINKEIEENY